MKKLLFLLFVLLCCGCSAKYEISFIDDNISDSLTITYPRDGQTDSQINDNFSNSFYSIGRSKLYNFENLSNENDVVINLSYGYNLINFKSSNIPNSCFEHFKFMDDDDKYYLFANGTFKCGYYAYEYLDSLDIIIDTNHDVIENNASEVIGDKYIWHVNTNDNNFELKFITSKKTHTIKEKKDYRFIIYTSISVTLFVLVIATILLIRHKRVNKI